MSDQPRATCPVCHGAGMSPCSACGGLGRDCRVCGGTGFVSCRRCAGTVRFSSSGHVAEAHVEGDNHSEVASVLRSLLPSASAAQRRPRPRLPARVEKQIYQEAGSRCSFCPEHIIAALEVHHIDGNPRNNAASNLLLVCASCHAKVTAGVIPLERVVARKQQLQAELAE